MMILKNKLLPSWLKFAAASLLLLPVAPVCAQKAPSAATPPATRSTPVKEQPPATSGAVEDKKPGTQPPATVGARAQAYYHAALASIDEDNVADGQQEFVNRAIEEYKLALNADPGSAELADALADLYFRAPGHVHDAEVTARALLKTSPNDIDAHKLLGRIYLRQLGEGENAGASPSATSEVLDQAIAEFEKIIALTPRSVDDRMVLGQLFTVKHDSAKAEEQFKIAKSIEPESEEVVLNLARLYAESGDLAHSAKVIEDVPVNDRTAKMEFALGAAYDQLKQSKDAIAAYQRAADMEPGDPRTLDALGQALMNNNQLDEAMKQYKQLAQADTENPEPLVHISEIQRREGKYEEALTTIQKARKLDPTSLEAGYNEGLLLDVLGRFDEAAQTYSSMVDLTSHANNA